MAGEGSDTPQIAKYRYDEQVQKTKDADKRADEAEARIEELERKSNEQANNYQSLYEAEQRKTARLQTKLNEQEQATAKAEQNLTEWRKRNTFLSAARETIRSDAIDDAFDLIPEADLEKLDPTDAKGFAKVATKLVDQKPYLANGKGGAGSGGSHAPVHTNGDSDPEKPRALPFNRMQRRRIT